MHVSEKQAGDNVSAAIKGLEVINPDTLRVIGLRILVKIADKERISRGGIILSGNEIDKDLFASIKGTIVAMGKRAFFEEDEADRPVVGDEVHIAKYSGIPLRDENYNLYRYTNDDDIIAVQGK
jgi:co-chaperonin GroES (HSP10)